MNIDNRIKTCLGNIGICIDTDEDNFLLSDVVEDSLMFVSLIIELEQEFEIEIPDEYLFAGRLTSLHDLYEMVQELMQIRRDG